MFHQFVLWLSTTVSQWGYPGIVVLMAIESSFFPFPSEIVIPPAAYLAATGSMKLSLVMLSGTVGSVLGAICNYLLAMYLGRPFLEKYGKYLLVSNASLVKSDAFFGRYGHVSTFIGRLLPGIRQYISIPAGLARMNFPLFCAATGFGAGLWVVVLACAGYWFGKNEELMLNNLRRGSFLLATIAAILAVAYWWTKRRRNGISANRPSQ
ncbi:DedA family protein [Desulfopila aestuarii]|uniref:Membrane protein DedA, SNARE-associated domain n=1 Tax=Desulfopila aestuarii DSM 18488 TaxID=1121416 RepID=A0A1M7XVG0_9BACT|nr:DedA family protein [Desulfopila aestuarii]SHO42548.1 membrane protein DedA, SNARE-associated domain [Desulfopila aestuarii DSM 18488]